MNVPEFTVPSYVNRPLGDIQSCINLYPEKVGDGYQLVSTSGLYLVGTLTGNEPPNGGICVIYNGERRIYVATSGGRIIRVYYDGTVTVLASGLTFGQNVSFAANETQVILCFQSATAYTITLSSDAVAAITDVNLPTLAWVTYHHGYIVGVSHNTQRVYLSELNDARDWTPVTYDSATSFPDNLKACVSVRDLIYLVGAETTEAWYLTQNAAFPIERVNGGTFPIGTEAEMTISALNGALYMVSTNGNGSGSVWKLEGMTPVKISTPAIEEAIVAIGGLTRSNIYANTYTENGHEFYELTAPTYFTYVYDNTLGLWHKRTSSSLGHHRCRLIFNAFPQANAGTGVYFFDSENGKFYTSVNHTSYAQYDSEDGTAIVRTRDFGPIGDGSRRIYHNQIRFEIEIKHDSSSSFTFAPTLTWTDDGGKTWATARTLTKVISSGTTAQRVMLTASRLGPSYKRIYRLSTSGPAARIILKSCDLQAEEGAY